PLRDADAVPTGRSSDLGEPMMAGRARLNGGRFEATSPGVAGQQHGDLDLPFGGVWLLARVSREELEPTVPSDATILGMSSRRQALALHPLHQLRLDLEEVVRVAGVGRRRVPAGRDRPRQDTVHARDLSRDRHTNLYPGGTLVIAD